MKGVKHYLKDGTVWTGGMHKMKDGSLHTGKTHTKSSKKLLHYGDLSKTALKNAAGNYTKPSLRKNIFNRVKAGGKGGSPGQWSARKAQMVAKAYKAKGGGYRG